MKQPVTRLIILVLLLQWLVGWLANRLNLAGSDYLVIAVTQLAAIFLPTIYYIKKHNPAEMFLVWHGNGWLLILPVICIAIGLNLVCQYINVPVLILLEAFGAEIGTGAVGETAGGFEIILTVFFVCVVPAFFEELLFRGVALGEYTQAYGRRRAILLTSLIFSWMHFDMASFLPQLLIGWMAAYLTVRTGTLTWAIVLHLANNLFSLYIQYQLAQFSMLVDHHPILVPIGAILLVLAGVGMVRRYVRSSEKRLVISQN